MVFEHWARLELAPWDNVKIPDLDKRLLAVPETEPAIGVFSINSRGVSISRLEADRLPRQQPDLVSRRAEAYAAFLDDVRIIADIERPITLAMRLDDRGPQHPDLPIFAFQKKRFEKTVLLPDIDLLQLGIYGGVDDTPFSAKERKAIFVGSTTGGQVTRASIDDGSHARIRAARFFSDKSSVRFELPVITQCDTRDTEEYLRSLALGSGYVAFSEHHRYRYMLSMDGNGAACSRVARGLAGNSALVKYASPYLLYYFHGLEPWVHYIPVRNDQDVLDLISNSDVTADRDGAVAVAGRAFAESHLTYANIREYAARLLEGYARLF